MNTGILAQRKYYYIVASRVFRVKTQIESFRTNQALKYNYSMWQTKNILKDLK